MLIFAGIAHKQLMLENQHLERARGERTLYNRLWGTGLRGRALNAAYTTQLGAILGRDVDQQILEEVKKNIIGPNNSTDAVYAQVYSSILSRPISVNFVTKLRTAIQAEINFPYEMRPDDYYAFLLERLVKANFPTTGAPRIEDKLVEKTRIALGIKLAEENPATGFLIHDFVMNTLEADDEHGVRGASSSIVVQEARHSATATPDKAVASTGSAVSSTMGWGRTATAVSFKN